jgi:hypothetical protein
MDYVIAGFDASPKELAPAPQQLLSGNNPTKKKSTASIPFVSVESKSSALPPAFATSLVFPTSHHWWLDLKRGAG